MADDFEQGDPRTTQYGGASAEQVAGLQSRYAPPAQASTGSAPKAADAPAPGKQRLSFQDAMAQEKARVTNPNAPVSKDKAITALQSATFGGAATVAGMIGQKQLEHSIRETEKNYRADHPLSAFGIDLVVASATGLIPGLGEANAAKVAASGAGLVARRAGTGAAIGGTMGANSVSTDESLGKHVRAGVEGAAVGAVASLGLSALGSLATPLLNRMGAYGMNQMRAAAEQIKKALSADGKTVDDLAKYVQQNPTARISDFSPKVASLIAKEGGRTQETNRVLGNNLREDAAGQSGRVAAGVAQAQPLGKVKAQMIADIDTLKVKMKQEYTQSKAEILPVTPELQNILSHPEVEPLFRQALKDYAGGRAAGVADLQSARKYKAGAELPSAVLDDLQKAVGKAAEEEGTGSIRYGTLKAAQDSLKNEQSGSIVNAQKLAARLGGAESETGVLGAQTWGHSFAFGVKDADPAQWARFRNDPEMVQYARLGMLDGLEKYLTNASRMPEGSLTKIADKLRSPQIEEVLGKKGANDVRKVFMNEAARQRVSASMGSGGSHQAAFLEKEAERNLGHEGNVVAAKAAGIPGLGTALRLAHAFKIPEKQALAMINIATKPDGAAQLAKAGVSKNVIDKIMDTIGRGRNAATAKGVEQFNINAER